MQLHEMFTAYPDSDPDLPSGEGVTATELQALLGQLPAEYASHMQGRTTTEYLWPLYTENIQGILRVWGFAHCLDMTQAHQIASNLPDVFPFADNGGGDFFAYTEATAQRQAGIYKFPFGAQDWDEAELIARDLRAILERGEGLPLIP